MRLYVAGGVNLKALGFKGFHDFLDVLGVAGLDHHVEFCPFEGNRLHHALVDHLDDVGAGLADDAGDIGELAGRIVNLEAQSCDAAVAD